MAWNPSVWTSCHWAWEGWEPKHELLAPLSRHPVPSTQHRTCEYLPMSLWRWFLLKKSLEKRHQKKHPFLEFFKLSFMFFRKISRLMNTCRRSWKGLDWGCSLPLFSMIQNWVDPMPMLSEMIWSQINQVERNLNCNHPLIALNINSSATLFGFQRYGSYGFAWLVNGSQLRVSPAEVQWNRLKDVGCRS